MASCRPRRVMAGGAVAGVPAVVVLVLDAVRPPLWAAVAGGRKSADGRGVRRGGARSAVSERWNPKSLRRARARGRRNTPAVGVHLGDRAAGASSVGATAAVRSVCG